MAELNLNPPMPPQIVSELDRRASAVKSKESAWMYKKYAYINISTTGKTQTALCPKQWSIGSAPTGKHTDLYTSEGGVRKMRPTITSVKMLNEGGQDYTDSYIYEIEFSFKVFSLDDLDKAEESFFTVGAEVAFDFGWIGTAMVSGINQTDKKLLANVYNFSFSIEDDGGFNCNVKCMSPNGLWSKESMGGTEKVKDPFDATEEKHASYLDALKKAFETTFGIVKPNPTVGAAAALASAIINVASGDENKLKGKADTMQVGKVSIPTVFWVAEVVSKHSFFNDTEDYFSYTNLDTLIKYINAKLRAGKSLFTYKIDTGELGKIHPFYEVGSADPTKVVLPGKYSKYGVSNFDWSTMSTVSYGGTGGTSADTIKGILLSIEYMNQVYLDLSTDSTSKKGGKKQPPKIQDFLKKIFNDIEQLTGGLVSIISLPSVTNQGKVETATAASPSTIIIANKRKTVVAGVTIKPYKFETLSKRSITKSISLDTDFDSDTLMLASKNAIGTGKSNFGALKHLYKNCDALTNAVDSATTGDAGGKITAEDLNKAKLTYELDGYTDQTIASMQDLNRNYLSQQVAADDTRLAGSQFTEMIWMLKLGVTIDGIFGIPFLAPITIDRLPKVYRDNDKAYFSITSVEHSFDGQGGWETTLDTVMRIQG
jgi:hypothetical protein